MTARWPAMMKRQTAASYCDLSEAAFEREVAGGRLPPPVTLGGRDHWSKAAMDRALSLISGEGMSDAERRFWNRGQAA